jgi:hypothetical protein
MDEVVAAARPHVYASQGIVGGQTDTKVVELLAAGLGLTLNFGVVISEETDAALLMILSGPARRRYDFVHDCHDLAFAQRQPDLTAAILGR